MKLTAALLSLLLLTAPLFASSSSSLSPATTNNNDSCDISLQPAATLLLPYFEVDFRSPQATARTMLFSVTNVSPQPQIAHVILWTDWGFPTMAFNIFLTGYDVQSINLYDIFGGGVVAPGNGTSNTTEVPTNVPFGSQPFENDANPNFLPSAAVTCSMPQGGVLSPSLVDDIRSIFTTGRGTSSTACGSANVGGAHENAIGYATIDVVATCTASMPTTDYYGNELLFDNVLIGDSIDINPSPAGNFAGATPMVHIRAVPAGGGAGVFAPTNLPYTFYDRYTQGLPTRTFDRRQPLPSTFAARWILGGKGAFDSSYKIWREGGTSYPGVCANYQNDNSGMPFFQIVRFDEHENARAVLTPCQFCPDLEVLPVASSRPTSWSEFPPLSSSGDIAGWMYFNLNNLGRELYSVAGGRDFRSGSSSLGGRRQSQNWVIVSMFAEGRFSFDMDAVAMGNGCSISPSGTQIAPSPAVTP